MEALNRLSGFCKRLLLAFLQGVEKSTRLQRIMAGTAIALLFALALYVRIDSSYDVVFGGEWVRYTGIDAYWHMRIVDNLVHNFPHLSQLDPYMKYPGGGVTSYQFPFFDYLVAGVIWIIGFGSPTQHTVDTIAPYFPPVMGALTIVPVYFIGKTVFSRWAGVFAAGLVAILPGEFLGRSILGFIDHHIAEALFSTTAVMFVILALKSAKKEPITWSQLRHPKGTALIRPAAYGACGGLFLGMYLASWMGALLFVLIMAVFLVVQFCAEHVKKTPTDYLCLVGVVTYLPALVIFLVFANHRNTAYVLLMAVLVPVIMFAISRLMVMGRLKRAYYPVAVIGLGLAAVGVLRLVWPSLVKPMLDNFEIFTWNRETTISEVVPMLYQRSGGVLHFSFDPLWQSYGFSVILGCIGVCALGYAVAKRWEVDKVFLLIWTLIILLAALGQRRFNYYLIVNVALLSGYVCWEVLRLAGLKELAREHVTVLRDRKRGPKSKRKREPQPESYQLRASHAFVTLAAIAIVALFTLVPYDSLDLKGTGKAKAVSMIDPAIESKPTYYPPAAWMEALTWLRDYADEPFGGPDSYYSRYTTPFDYTAYPEAYGVTAWWDYGYWIVRIGHRPPSQNPAGAIPSVAEFFVAQDASEGSGILEKHRARYVILDYDFVAWKLDAAMSITGKSVGDFYEYFVEPVKNAEGKITSYQIGPFYFPDYYRLMSIRLYCFEGKAVTPGSGDCKVITWEWWEREGERYKLIVDKRGFNSPEQASAWIASQPSGNYEIVGESPFVSPVPLEELEGFSLSHDSETKVGSGGVSVPQVRIFKYAKPG